MAGLETLFGSDPQQRGILAAAAQILQASGPSLRPQSLGQIIGAGLGAYQDAEQQARQFNLLERARAAQLQDAELDLQSKREARELQQQIRDAAKGSYRTAGQQAAALPGGPTAANAARIGDFEDGFDSNAFINRVMQFAPLQALELRKSLAKAGPKYDAGITWVNGPNGQPVAVRTADDGSIKQLAGLAPREKLEFRDGGNAVLGVDPYTGERRTSIAKGVDPSTVYSAQAAAARSAASDPSNKPLPAAALKMVNDGLESLATANGINSQLATIRDQIKGGKLSFGPVSNLVNQGLNAAGMSTEQSRNFAGFRVTLEKLRNDSLRLNTGVQTDGDAQREWNALFQNINDTDWVLQRLEQIERINERGAQLQKLKIDGVRGNYGHAPLDFSKYDRASSAPTTAPSSGGGWSIQRVN